MAEKRYVLYKHTSPCGKVYIGITCRPVATRWGVNGIRYRRHPYLWSAIQKYGWDSFKHEILFNNLSKAEASEKEKEYIAKYRSNTQEYGYNLTSGGEVGYCFSPEIFAKQSAGIKKKWREPEFLEKMRIACEARRGKHFSLSEETKQKMRKPKSEETRAKMRKPKSTETRQKMSEAKKRYFANMTPEQREAFADKFRKHKNETTDTSRES